MILNVHRLPPAFVENSKPIFLRIITTHSCNTLAMCISFNDVCMCFCRSGSSEYFIHTLSFFILNRTKQDYNLSNHDFKSTLQLSTPTQYSNSRSCVVKGKSVHGRRGWHVTSRGGDWAYHTIGNPYLHNTLPRFCITSDQN